MPLSTRQSHHDVGARVQALSLLEYGVPASEVTLITRVAKSTLYDLRKTAIARGYNPSISKIVLLEYVQDGARSGRPRKVTEEVKNEVIQVISKNLTTRTYTTQSIANVLAQQHIFISARSVWNILQSSGYHCYKPTYKPGLTLAAKAKRLEWCLEHKDWTLEQWKNVIWSDETSVTMGGQRGRIRVWRKQSEAYNDHCIRRQWKRFKQFMFWGCFSYDKKGPCHIWTNESSAEQKEANLWVAKQNEILELLCKQQWELETGMQRIRLTRNMPGKKPVWKWGPKTGKLVRKSNSGID